MLIPGETVSFLFYIPFSVGDVETVVITCKQNDNVIIVKTITSGFEQGRSQGETKITFPLTQEESLIFQEKNRTKVQVNVLTKNGTRAASKEKEFETGNQHFKEVINGG